ncbi:hypothetical protein F5146DRAFT_1145490 [Armillaria mellea]|nr:hypothetical protein F5146DRAFT_1145490 [Armillaria mellea]
MVENLNSALPYFRTPLESSLQLEQRLSYHSPLSNFTMAVSSFREIKNEQKYSCGRLGCDKRFTREFDVKRHQKQHLSPKLLQQEKYSCPTETGCNHASLQRSNLKGHIRAKQDIFHLMCFDCRPAYQRLPDSIALANHIQVEHPPTQKQTICGSSKPRPTGSISRSRTEWYRASPDQLALYKKARDACRVEHGLQLPSPVPSLSTTGEGLESSWSRSPLPSPSPTNRPITPASAFDTVPSRHANGTLTRSPTPPYTARFIRDDRTEARRCHLPTRRSLTVPKKMQCISGMDRTHHLHSLVSSSSTIGEGSGSSSSRFPLPPPPPPTSWRIMPASTVNTCLPSPSSSGAS